MRTLKRLRKRILDSDRFARGFAVVFAGYLKLVRAMCRFERRGFQALDDAMQGSDPPIVVFWHQRTFMTQFALDLSCGPLTCLNSSKRAGRNAAATMNRFGWSTVNIKSNAADPVGLREVARRLAAGETLAIAADGSRGPPRVCSDAPTVWACKSGRRVFAVGASWRRWFHLATWDRMTLPLPFSRGVAVCVEWGETLPRKASDEAVEAARLAIEALLDRATDEADVAVGRKPEEQPAVKPERPR